MNKASFEPSGVIPAALLPFYEDYNIDESALRSHLRDIAGVAGISAITVNGHASEVSSCSFDEQRRVLDIALDEIGGSLPIVNGVYADGSLEAARLAEMGHKAGASAHLVFPPAVFTLGQRPEMVIDHFRRIAEASDLPIIAFQYPGSTGQGYSIDTLTRLLDEIPTIRAIKDWTPSVPLHEKHIRLLTGRSRPVNVLSTNSAWLLSSLVLGCQGLLSGAGSVIANLHVDLWNAVQAQRLDEAKRVYERIRCFTDVFYSEPLVDMHNRMKVALVLLGRLPRAVVRPPLMKLDDAEVERIRIGLVKAGWLTIDGQRAA